MFCLAGWSWVIHQPFSLDPLESLVMQDLEVFNPERNPIPSNILDNANPKFRPSKEEWKARRAGKFQPSPMTPLPEGTLPFACWKARGPEGSLETASVTLADVQAEISGELIRKGRNIYFSKARLEQAMAFSRADARFVAMHRTRKGKAGDSSLGNAEAALEDAIFQISSIESQIIFCRKALKQKHIGKLRISKRKRDYAIKTLPSLKKARTRCKRVIKKYERLIETQSA